VAKDKPIGTLSLGPHGALNAVDRDANAEVAYKLTGHPDGETAAAELNAIGSHGQGHVDAVVHRHPHATWPAYPDDRLRKIEQLARGGLMIAHLDPVRTVLRGGPDHRQQPRTRQPGIGHDVQ
jgi:hypothetical protein